jgi:hypothetical protein
MTVILLVVVVIKCIPKYKLPYCLGGTREQEQFVCIKEYRKWCDSNGIPHILNQSDLMNKNKSQAMEETCKRLNINRSLLKPF